MVVLDSSFLVALHNARDVHHEAAARGVKALLRGEWGKALLPEYVFLEVTTVLAARRGVSTAVEVGEVLLSAEEVEFVSCSDLFSEAWSVFRDQRPVLSFADAAIVAIARLQGASRIATFDMDFAGVEGLSVVP